MTLSFAVTDTAGLVVPANLAGILGMKDSDGNVYLERDETNLSDLDIRRRWYYAEPVETALSSGTNITINPGTVDVTGPTFTAAQFGEYVQISDAIGLYKIVTASTITPAFRGDEEVAGAYYAIRPEGTPRIGIVNADGDITAATMTCHYWQYPYPLMQNYDLVPLPSTRALELGTAIRYWGEFKGKHEEADRYKAPYLKALSAVKAMSPMKITPQRQRDVRGRQLVLGRRRW